MSIVEGAQEEAAKHGDPRQADSFAERAQILAKELQSEQ